MGRHLLYHALHSKMLKCSRKNNAIDSLRASAKVTTTMTQLVSDSRVTMLNQMAMGYLTAAQAVIATAIGIAVACET